MPAKRSGRSGSAAGGLHNGVGEFHRQRGFQADNGGVHLVAQATGNVHTVGGVGIQHHAEAFPDVSRMVCTRSACVELPERNP